MKHVKFILMSLMSLLVTFCANADTTNVIESIESSVVWDVSGSPYIIGDTIAPPGDTIHILTDVELIIEPGVEVIFRPFVRLEIDSAAKLIANGTINDSITFTTLDTTQPSFGLKFNKTADGCLLSYCVFHKIHFRAIETGGAIQAYDSDLTISNCRISGNDALEGAGLYFENTNAVVENCLIINNKASFGSGGGLLLRSSEATLINNIIRGNVSTSTLASGGGGIYCDYGSFVKIINNTIYDNYANNFGGGIYIENSIVKILNTIIWENVAMVPTGHQIYKSGILADVQVAYSDVKTSESSPGITWRDGNITDEPIFLDYMCHIDFSSPCKNRAIESYLFDSETLYAPSYDFEGDSRPYDSFDLGIDIGADELGCLHYTFQMLDSSDVWCANDSFQVLINTCEDAEAIFIFGCDPFPYAESLDVQHGDTLIIYTCSDAGSLYMAIIDPAGLATGDTSVVYTLPPPEFEIVVDPLINPCLDSIITLWTSADYADSVIWTSGDSSWSSDTIEFHVNGEVLLVEVFKDGCVGEEEIFFPLSASMEIIDTVICCGDEFWLCLRNEASFFANWVMTYETYIDTLDSDSSMCVSITTDDYMPFADSFFTVTGYGYSEFECEFATQYNINVECYDFDVLGEYDATIGDTVTICVDDFEGYSIYWWEEIGDSCITIENLLDDTLINVTVCDSEYADTIDVDIVFYVDATGSMEYVLDEVRADITEFVTSLSSYAFDWRLGGVAVADNGPIPWNGGALTSSASSFISWLSHVPGYWNEKPVKSLKSCATNTDWRPDSKRIIILVQGESSVPWISETLTPYLREEVIDSLLASNVVLYSFYEPHQIYHYGDEYKIPYYEDISHATGGEAYDLSVLVPSDIIDTLTSRFLTTIRYTGCCIDTFIHIEVDGCTDSNAVFVSDTYYFSVPRDYAQERTVAVRNQGNTSSLIRAFVRNGYDDLVIDFFGQGSSDLPYFITPLADFDLQLSIGTQNACGDSYFVPCSLQSINECGDTTWDHAILAIDLEDTDFDLSVIDLGQNPGTLARNYLIINNGDLITDLAVNVDPAIDSLAYVLPVMNHVMIEPGDSIQFEVYPVLSAFDTLMFPVPESVLLFSGELWISGACTSITIGYEAILPEGMTICDTVIHCALIETYDYDTYCTNRPYVEQEFYVPPGFENTDILDGYFKMNIILIPRWVSYYRNHSIQLIFNGLDISVDEMQNTVPSGSYRIPITSFSHVNTDLSYTSLNSLEFYTYHPNRGHYGSRAKTFFDLVVDSHVVYIASTDCDSSYGYAIDHSAIHQITAVDSLTLISPLTTTLILGEQYDFEVMAHASDTAGRVMDGWIEGCGPTGLIRDDGVSPDSIKDDRILTGSFTPDTTGFCMISICVPNPCYEDTICITQMFEVIEDTNLIITVIQPESLELERNVTNGILIGLTNLPGTPINDAEVLAIGCGSVDTFELVDSMGHYFVTLLPVSDCIVCTVEVIATNPGYSSATTELHLDFTSKIQLYRGWNMVSNPMDSVIKDDYFGSITTYTYDSTFNYIVTDSLIPGYGYWVLRVSDTLVHYCGGIDSITIPIHRGWNMIGALGRIVSEANITTDPPGIGFGILWGWNPWIPDYYDADFLYPGRAYWFLSEEQGSITIHW